MGFGLIQQGYFHVFVLADVFTPISNLRYSPVHCTLSHILVIGFSSSLLLPSLSKDCGPLSKDLT